MFQWANQELKMAVNRKMRTPNRKVKSYQKLMRAIHFEVGRPKAEKNSLSGPSLRLEARSDIEVT